MLIEGPCWLRFQALIHLGAACALAVSASVFDAGQHTTWTNEPAAEAHAAAGTLACYALSLLHLRQTAPKPETLTWAQQAVASLVDVHAGELLLTYCLYLLALQLGTLNLHADEAPLTECAEAGPGVAGLQTADSPAAVAAAAIGQGMSLA